MKKNIDYNEGKDKNREKKKFGWEKEYY
jgi:hypothetical protein